MIGARPAIPGARYGERIAEAREALRSHGGRALLIGVGADLRYLTGYVAMPLERLTMLVIPAAGPASLVCPRLEAMAAARCAAAELGVVDVVAWDETDDAHAVVAGLLAAAGGPVRAGGPVYLSDRLWALHVLGLRRALGEADLRLASDVLRTLRSIKDETEIALLRIAAHAADRVVAEIAHGRLVGRSEADVSREVRERLEVAGHERAEFAIVASGPNAASPHHEAGDRVIEPGDPIVLDIGGSLSGYCSDTTRTLWVTGPGGAVPPDPAFARLFSTLHAAQAAASAAVRPGIACEALDAVARTIIDGAGYGEQFFHRLGHGIGLDTHEDPYLVAGNAELLAPGMAFSVEPGIYVAGRYGARIEDIVVCGAAGLDALNQSERDLWVVPG